MLKADKVTFVNDLTGQLKEAKGLLLVNYSGLGVKAQQELKARLGQSGAKMVVVKNTLLKRAGEAAGIDKGLLDESILQGQTALVIAGEDPVAPIQVIGSFAKEFETPKFKVGVIDGAFQNSEALGKISSLPGRDALLSQLLGTLMSSEYGLVGTLQGNLQKLVYILKTKAG